MELLDIENVSSKEVYLKFLDDLIFLLRDYREKIRQEIYYYDELC